MKLVIQYSSNYRSPAIDKAISYMTCQHNYRLLECPSEVINKQYRNLVDKQGILLHASGTMPSHSTINIPNQLLLFTKYLKVDNYVDILE